MNRRQALASLAAAAIPPAIAATPKTRHRRHDPLLASISECPCQACQEGQRALQSTPEHTEAILALAKAGAALERLVEECECGGKWCGTCLEYDATAFGLGMYRSALEGPWVQPDDFGKREQAALEQVSQGDAWEHVAMAYYDCLDSLAALLVAHCPWHMRSRLLLVADQTVAHVWQLLHLHEQEHVDGPAIAARRLAHAEHCQELARRARGLDLPPHLSALLEDTEGDVAFARTMLTLAQR